MNYQYGQYKVILNELFNRAQLSGCPVVRDHQILWGQPKKTQLVPWTS